MKKYKVVQTYGNYDLEDKLNQNTNLKLVMITPVQIPMSKENMDKNYIPQLMFYITFEEEIK